jgi:hypothetical protein
MKPANRSRLIVRGCSPRPAAKQSWLLSVVPVFDRDVTLELAAALRADAPPHVLIPLLQSKFRFVPFDSNGILYDARSARAMQCVMEYGESWDVQHVIYNFLVCYAQDPVWGCADRVPTQIASSRCVSCLIRCVACGILSEPSGGNRDSSQLFGSAIVRNHSHLRFLSTVTTAQAARNRVVPLFDALWSGADTHGT